MRDQMHSDVSSVELSVDGAQVRCETQLQTAGAYVLAVTTVVPELRCLLASSFLLDVAGQAVVSHLWETAGATGQLSSTPLTLVNHRLARGCVLEHLACLRDQLRTELVGADVRLDIPEEALLEAEAAWSAV